jgi:hypothetical protein
MGIFAPALTHKTTVKNAQFLLGDFASFALFADELIGEQAHIGRP